MDATLLVEPPARTPATASTSGLSGRVRRAFAAHLDRSPLLVVDPDVVVARYHQLRRVLPTPAVFYAVKANPDPVVLGVLAALGSRFDVASMGEVRACLAAGARPSDLSYGNPTKKATDIAVAHALGIQRFAFDSRGELDKLVAHAPGTIAHCRLACDGAGSAWPLGAKFGCSVDDAFALLCRADAGGLRAGLSFHVGSQQADPHAWAPMLRAVADLRDGLRAVGVELASIDLGGGLPGTYRDEVPPIERYGAAIEADLRRHLGGEPGVELLVEPGRFLVADAGVLRTEVVAVCDRGPGGSERWAHLDVGVFTGLVESSGEAICYRVVTDRPGEPCRPHVLAGPTCDSVDVLYRRRRYDLPTSLRPGDHLYLTSLGAYSAAYSTVGFNGFPPLDVEVLVPS